MEIVEHLFRRQYSQILARLTRVLGPSHLDLAEEAVQEAMVSALQRWPFSGVPDSPAGWLLTVARNKALDRLRRRARFREKETFVLREIEGLERSSNEIHFESEVVEDQLRMMFLCCHPALTRESAVTLVLKIVGGFGVAEIARAFLSQESSIAQRLVRAKKKLREAEAPFEMPGPERVASRLDPVLDALYLIFNEGYCALQGDQLIRRDMCAEAIRLAELLSQHPQTGDPKIEALLALFLLQSARTPARLDTEGNLLLLAEQDRRLWDHGLIRRGFAAFERSIAGTHESRFHVEAAIAAAHCSVRRFEDTDWNGILNLYDRLTALYPTPVVALNRAVAVAFASGPLAALREIESLSDEPTLKRYFPLPAVRASLLVMLGRSKEAAAHYRRALDLPCSEPEKRFLQARLQEAEAGFRPDWLD